MIKITNKQLKMVGDFLRDDLVTDTGIQNVHRMRVVKHIDQQLEELEEERIEIIKKYAETDENGEIIQDDKGNVTLYNTQALDKELDSLFSEICVLDAPKLKPAFKSIANLVVDFQGQLKGDAGEAHFVLVEELEDLYEEEKGEE